MFPDKARGLGCPKNFFEFRFGGRITGANRCPEATKIIPSQMEVAPLHCTVDITQKRRLFKNTKEIEKM